MAREAENEIVDVEGDEDVPFSARPEFDAHTRASVNRRPSDASEHHFDDVTSSSRDVHQLASDLQLSPANSEQDMDLRRSPGALTSRSSC